MMFDSPQQKPWPSLEKAATICTVGLGLGIGTCGVGALAGNKRDVSWVLVFGSVLFFGSLLGLIVIGLVAVIRAVMDALRR